MDEDQIRAFLNRIATDPAYRAQLESDPVGTLAELGITIDPNDVPPEGIDLPSNEEILASLDELVDQFWHNACLSHQIHLLWGGG